MSGRSAKLRKKCLTKGNVMGLFEDLKARGLVFQTTSDEHFEAWLSERPRTLYCGFDPTADSLHIGSLVPLLTLRRFQLAGHTPIALVGGATGLIGDPSFKAQERALNTPDIVAGWVERLRTQMSQFLSFDGDAAAVMANNLDWTAEVDVLTFLRDVGKHFSVNSMISKESVKQRIEREGSGISFTEFTYMILQSFDFAELNKRFGCELQIGGLRPVGKYHRWYRSHSSHEQRVGPRSHYAIGYEGGWDKVW